MTGNVVGNAAGAARRWRLKSRAMLPQIVLASTSPRRRELLSSLRLAFEVRPSDIDETLFPGEDPYQAAERLAREKAAAGCRGPDELVVAADTIVVLDGVALGKPADRADARRMLSLLEGRRHEVVTGVALLWRERCAVGREVSEVDFAPMSSDEIARYVDTGETDDKAGAYALQGIGSLFVAGVAGSPSNVVGLPLRLFALLARQLGVDLLDR